MHTTRPAARRRPLAAPLAAHRAAALLAMIAAATVACAPAVGLSAPFHGEATYNPATTNFEGRMSACSPDGGPITVAVDGWGYDIVHPFLIEVTDSGGAVIAARSAVGPDDVLVTQPLVRSTCFGVRITSPGATGRSYYTFAVGW